MRDLRKEYTRHGLDEADLADDPAAMLRNWFEQALKSPTPPPGIMRSNCPWAMFPMLITCTTNVLPQSPLAPASLWFPLD